MKIVVIGGSGLIGSKLVKNLDAQGHEAVSAALETGVNTLTGEGVAEVLVDADAVVDVSNSPSIEGSAALKFFETSTRNLIAAATDAGVGHYVALSVVGSERLPDSGYMRAKVAQERLITASGIPYSLVHATQFFEFVQGIIDAATEGDTVYLAPVLIQPMAADDVAAAVAEVVVDAPTNAVVEVGGPEQFHLDELGRSVLAAQQDPRSVVASSGARYFGATLGERSLVPADGARIAGTRLDDWRTRTNHRK
jgi:uncharacterized protein YbjT (DUF2867 family)